MSSALDERIEQILDRGIARLTATTAELAAVGRELGDHDAVQAVVAAAVRLVTLRDREREAQRVGQAGSTARPLASSPPRSVFTEARRVLDDAVHLLGGES